MTKKELGAEMYGWAKDLFPICRSLTGKGNLETLKYLQDIAPKINIKKIPSGQQVFDWEVPDEWNINEAWIKDEHGKDIINFTSNNLHVMGYSTPIDKKLPFKDLEKHLFSLPDRPDAIPYVTSYYSRNWGFCLSENQRNTLDPSLHYHAFIDSSLEKGCMYYGEAFLPGKSDKEIFLSTYICHPSMANNELSGPVVTTMLIKSLLSLDLNYSYRIIFVPETIGSIAYLSQHHTEMKRNMIAGFNVTCIGDNRCYSFLPSREGNTESDRVAKHTLRNIDKDYKKYSWIQRGSDERQYCAPGIDLPVASIMRSKYGEYPEYHSSDDNLDFISQEGLEGGYNAIYKALESIEKNCYPNVKVLGEPMLSKRGLYPETSTLDSQQAVQILMDFISYCDGKKDMIEIAELVGVPIWELYDLLDNLIKEKIIDIEPKY
tara:strand:- start:17475 stop:18770 length:1296 start_codon:yes stop_codon:yes gene_type:complete